MPRVRKDEDAVPVTIVERRSGWRLIDFKELREHADLLRYFVLRDLQVRYRQTVLGFLWAIVQPLLSMLVFAFVFGRLAGMRSDGTPYPAFAYVALVPWMYFSRALLQSSNSLISSGNLLNRVYFPRMLIPVTPVLSTLVDFVISFAFVIVLLVGYGIAPNAGVLVLPLLVLIMMATALGAGFWLSSTALQYRDVAYIMGFLTQILMYLAPVVWPLSLVPSHLHLPYGLYPMAGVIEGFRSALLGTRPMPWDLIGMGCLTSTVLLVSGAFYFRRREQLFADVA